MKIRGIHILKYNLKDPGKEGKKKLEQPKHAPGQTTPV